MRDCCWLDKLQACWQHLRMVDLVASADARCLAVATIPILPPYLGFVDADISAV
jgi:hypothetical protein